MTYTAPSGQETASNLASFGAVVVDHSDPSCPIVYRAGHQDISQGFVHLTIDNHSRKMQLIKAERNNPRALNKYAALARLSPQMKAGSRAAALQAKGLGRYAALHHRASLRAAPIAKPAPVAAPTKTISVGQLAMKKPEPTRPQSLSSRMSYWAQARGFMPNLMAV